MDILNVPSLKVTEVHENEHDYYITAEVRLPPFACPACGCKPNLYRFGMKKQLLMDLPIRAKRVGITLQRQRYRCRECGVTFLEPLADMDEKRLATKRLVSYIEKQSLKRTFASIAEDVGLDEKTIRNIFRDYVTHLEKSVRFLTPKWMGIDEIHLIRQSRCIITNVNAQTVIDILPNRNKDAVSRYLASLPDRHTVHFVTMDMWDPYRDAVRTVLPQVIIVVDKFHVLRLANYCLETARKEHRADLTAKQRRRLMHDRFILLKRRADLTMQESLVLEAWINAYPVLAAAYEAKEAFYAIWDSKTRQEAETKYAAWQVGLPKEIRAAYKPLTTAVRNWHREIFAYFDHRITNAYTESLNNLVRVINRMGRGYSFDALRAKILFTEGVPKAQRPRYNRRMMVMNEISYRSLDMLKDVFRQDAAEEYVSPGMPISTLVKLIEQGEV